MSFSKREKILISVFAVLAVTVLYFTMFLTPQLEQISELRSIISEETVRLDLNLIYKQRAQGLDTDMKIFSQKLKNLRNEFPPMLYYDEVLILLRDVASTSGLNIQSLSFSEPTEVTGLGQAAGSASIKAFNDSALIREENLKTVISELGLDDLAVNQQNVTIQNGRPYSLSVNISATGTNDQAKHFFALIENLKNKTGIERITINNSSNGMLTLNLSINFYGIKENSQKDYSILEDNSWQLLERADRDNIFLPYEGFSGLDERFDFGSNPVDINAVLKELETYSFTMNVVPFGEGMAPPTISLGLKSMVLNADYPHIPIIYGDGREFVDVEIYVEEKDGLFYTKFKTDQEAFPNTAYSKLVEFTPRSEDIKLIIESTSRLSSTDVSGVNIKVINKTTKQFVAVIRNDDKDNPRVVFNNIQDNVTVTIE